MAQPYIDCAKRLAARGIRPEDIREIVCEVAEGTVHRLWEPLADKQRPGKGKAPKFAVPSLLAVGAAPQQTAPAQWLCRQIRGAVSAGGGIRAWRRRTRRIHRASDPRSTG